MENIRTIPPHEGNPVPLGLLDVAEDEVPPDFVEEEFAHHFVSLTFAYSIARATLLCAAMALDSSV